MVYQVQARAQFDHVCNVVLCRNDGSLLKRALVQEGFDTIPSLLSIDDDMILSLAFKDGGSQALVINRGDLTLIKSFRNFAVTRATGGITVEDEWLTMTAEDFDAFRVRSLGTPLASLRSAAAGTTTTGPTPRSLVAIGHHGANRDSGAFLVPRNKCWPGHTIPPLALSTLASSPSKSNGIAVPAAGTDGHWLIHATASPVYRAKLSTTVTGSMSPTSVFNDVGKEQSAPKVKMGSAPNSQAGLVHEEACSIANTVMNRGATQVTLSVKDTVVSTVNATRVTTLGFSTPPPTLAPSATSAVLALPVFSTPPPAGISKCTVTTGASIVGTGLDHDTLLSMCGPQAVQAVLVATESGADPWAECVTAPSTTNHATVTSLSTMVPGSCGSMVSMAITSTTVDGIPGLVTFPLPPSSSTVKDEWLAMTEEDFDAFQERSIDTSFSAPCNDVVGPTTTGPTLRSTIDIGHRVLKRDWSAFPAAKNEPWPGSAIPRSTLPSLPSPPCKGNDIAAPTVATIDTWSDHTVSSPIDHDMAKDGLWLNTVQVSHMGPAVNVCPTVETAMHITDSADLATRVAFPTAKEGLIGRGPISKMNPGDIRRIMSNFGPVITWKLLTAHNLQAELVCGEAVDNDDTNSNDQDPHLFKKGVPQVTRSRCDEGPNQVTSIFSPTPAFNS
jgi:hypothetical protein